MNKKYKLNPRVIGVGGYELNLEKISLIKIIETNYFLKNYKISKILWGKFVLKKQILRVFKRSIYQKMNWQKKFWEMIEVKLINTEIPKNEYLNPEKIEMQIKPFVKSRRFKDIKKYQKLICNGSTFPPPLYISGRALNFLGAKVDNNLLYILDGSRRITAHILSRKNPKIILIEMKGLNG